MRSSMLEGVWILLCHDEKFDGGVNIACFFAVRAYHARALGRACLAHDLHYRRHNPTAQTLPCYSLSKEKASTHLHGTLRVAHVVEVKSHNSVEIPRLFIRIPHSAKLTCSGRRCNAVGASPSASFACAYNRCSFGVLIELMSGAACAKFFVVI